ncbi:RidA family protein [Zavarzinia sp. CC-PAN008]|uniref:RidA family protein n=1 Tax=Zavarzinia sp. CC-PAN008 TaxID=3243332 RepID=UPI003F74A29B
MAGRIDERLRELGIELPVPAAPAANYVPYVLVEGQCHIAGQLPVSNGNLVFKGKVGSELTIEGGYRAARLCAINLLAQLRVACDGDLDRVARVVKLGGYVFCGDGFTEHPKVVNGASDLMADVFGDAGRHARIAVGCPSLPLGAAVEVDGLFEIY